MERITGEASAGLQPARHAGGWVGGMTHINKNTVKRSRSPYRTPPYGRVEGVAGQKCGDGGGKSDGAGRMAGGRLFGHSMHALQRSRNARNNIIREREREGARGRRRRRRSK